jgi:DNA modification methylase
MSDTAIPAEYLNQIVTGDARKLAARLPDASVDLIFTDPVYDRIEDYRWLAETAARVLKPDGSALVFAWGALLPDVFAAMTALQFEWPISLYISNRTIDTRCKVGFNKWTPCLWYSRGKPIAPRTADLMQCNAFQALYGDGRSNHQWSKSPEFMLHYMAAFTRPGAVVLDTFVGGGTTAAVAKQLKRNYIAFEIDPATAEKARERVALTQVPLWVPEPVQDALPLEAA